MQKYLLWAAAVLCAMCFIICGCSPKLAESGKAAKHYSMLKEQKTFELKLTEPSENKLEGTFTVKALLKDNELAMAELEKKREENVVFGENYQSELARIKKETGEYIIYVIIADRITRKHPHPADDINKTYLKAYLVDKHDIKHQMAMQDDESPTAKINTPEIAGDRTDYYSHTEILVKFMRRKALKEGHKLVVETKFGTYEAQR